MGDRDREIEIETERKRDRGWEKERKRDLDGELDSWHLEVILTYSYSTLCAIIYFVCEQYAVHIFDKLNKLFLFYLKLLELHLLLGGVLLISQIQ